MKLIAKNNLRFSLVDTEAFRDFIQYLDLRLILKSATTFSRYELPLLYNNVKAKNSLSAVELPPQKISGHPETMTLTNL